MKTWKILLAGTVIAGAAIFVTLPEKKAEAKGCVFRTIFGEESGPGMDHPIPEKVSFSLEKGMDWIVEAQNTGDGGWGAGSHARQNVMDPHSVQTDPATTAMVGMALMRTGSTLETGKYSKQVKSALNYLLDAVEKSSSSSLNITDLTGTQIQTKLGANIDVVMASQFLSNVIDYAGNNIALKERIKKCQNICVKKIQKAQESDGSTKGAGWAGVLQSSFATNALEAAETKGADVDRVSLEKAKKHQQENYDPASGNVNTDRGAGVVLYSVSGSTRASAKEARRVKEVMAQAKQEGVLDAKDEVNVENLEKAGMAKEDAIKYSTVYNVYESAKVKAQQSDVLNGFGNNGGEEFLSYLQTGESMVINKDNDWKNWYDKTAGRLVTIQNTDGSWNGHHCITSPVFCTATCLLILSVNNDIERLTNIGK